MIKTQNLTPEIYYKRSRDFQLLGRVCDFVFNYLKNNTHAVENNLLGELFDYKLIDLVATTLGFKKAHDYDSTQLKAFCSTFSYLLRNKGNLTSIKTLLNVLANAQNIKETIEVSYDASKYLLQVWVPESLKELALFEDTLDYILPAGLSYVIVRGVLKSRDVTSKHRAMVTAESESVHAMIKSQLYNPYSAENTLKDTQASMFDNMTLLKALESGEDIENYVKNPEVSEE